MAGVPGLATELIGVGVNGATGAAGVVGAAVAVGEVAGEVAGETVVGFGFGFVAVGSAAFAPGEDGLASSDLRHI